MKINEVAKLTGISVRTLHYYDQIGLLRPAGTTESGYRVYGESELSRLQQILFFRELDFPLAEIREILESPAYDRNQALARHLRLLTQKRDRLNGLIALADKTLKGEAQMDFKAFSTDELDKARTAYAEEVKQRWGGTEAYLQNEQRTAAYSGGQWKALGEEGAGLIREFGESRGTPPDSGEAFALVKKWRDYISKYFYECSLDILAGLGEMYVGDERFTRSIDDGQPGTAEFMSRAIAAYCAKESAK